MVLLRRESALVFDVWFLRSAFQDPEQPIQLLLPKMGLGE